MEMKFKEGSFQSLMIRLAASNLITTRKMCDLIIIQLAKGDSSLAAGLSAAFRQETEAAIQLFLDKIYEHDGDISIDDILGKGV